MKKFYQLTGLLILFSAISAGLLEASPVSSVDLKAGRIGASFIYDYSSRHIEGFESLVGGAVAGQSRYQIKRNLFLFEGSYDWNDRIQGFIRLGGNTLDQDIESLPQGATGRPSNNKFSYGGSTVVGLGGRFIPYKWKARDGIFHNLDFNSIFQFTIHGSQKSKLTNGATSVTRTGGYNSFDLAGGLTKHYDNWNAYTGIKYSDVSFDEKESPITGASPNFLTTGTKLNASDNIGLYFGFDYKYGYNQNWRWNVEGRFIDENALSTGLTYLFRNYPRDTSKSKDLNTPSGYAPPSDYSAPPPSSSPYAPTPISGQSASRNPAKSLQFNQVGESLFQQKDYEGAKGAFTKSIEFDPNNDKALNNLGSVFLNQGQYSKALDQYLEAVLVKPNNASYHYNLGIAYYRVGNKANAASEFKKAHDLNPSNQQALKNYQLLSK